MFGINSMVILPLDTIGFKMPTMDSFNEKERPTVTKNDVKSENSKLAREKKSSRLGLMKSDFSFLCRHSDTHHLVCLL